MRGGWNCSRSGDRGGRAGINNTARPSSVKRKINPTKDSGPIQVAQEADASWWRWPVAALPAPMSGTMQITERTSRPMNAIRTMAYSMVGQAPWSTTPFDSGC